MQMGLNLISVDGMTIKRMKTYLLQCFACNTLVKDPTKVFCPSCGNNTLKKTSVILNKKGEVVRIFSTKKPINTRGTVYSLPKPKGGKFEKQIILNEDDTFKMKFRKKKEPNLFDVEGLLVDDRSKTPSFVVGLGKKNPNIPSRKIGKKNKSVHA